MYFPYESVKIYNFRTCLDFLSKLYSMVKFLSVLESEVNRIRSVGLQPMSSSNI